MNITAAAIDLRITYSLFTDFYEIWYVKVYGTEVYEVVV